ncbi:MAG TPA: MBL fold metallo-hydrolase [Chitinophagaceae bacterium]
MTIYFLDMGLKQYGDCIVIIQGNRKILVDFGKPSDQSSLRLQLKKILQQDPPFHFNLLIMTHNHDDHIGSFPEMIGGGEITADKYLLTDPAYRWGKVGESDSDSAVVRDGITEALLEEDHSNLPDDELEQFLSDIEQTVVRYRRMIKNLKAGGADVTLFRGRDATPDKYDALEQEFSDFGLKILGPTKRHLQLTQTALLGIRDSIADFLDNSFASDAFEDRVDLYRKLFSKSVSDNEFFLDAKKNSGSINNESIIIKVAEDNFSTLLTGDMQFAIPAVTDIEDEMNALIKKVFVNGPYDLIKTSHHTSDNGISTEMYDKWISEGTEFFVHSGGKIDEDHPDPEVLKVLKARKSKIQFARTDRNGVIKAEKENGKVTLSITKGSFNNFTQNVEGDAPVEVGEKKIEGKSEGVLNPEPENKPVTPPVSHAQGSKDVIEISAKIPVSLTTVTITIDTSGEKKKPIAIGESPRIDEPSGGRFENLLFVTNSSVLKENIGIAETKEVLDILNNIPGARLLDIPSADIVETAKLVANKIESNTKGIVIIGGYDVIPSAQLNVLSDEMRKKIEDEAEDDEDTTESDDFIVWCDDIYGDTDNDFLPELPVSRIPDGKSANLLRKALQAPSFTIQNKFGIRNIMRPFAIDVFDKIPFKDKTQFEVSEKCSPKLVAKDQANGAVYFMLHGSHSDATRFAGEKEESGSFEAFDIYNVPKSAPGAVIFSGCCYGALIALPKADRKEPDISLRSRTSEQSIALAFLQSSANAFIGCTGAHYSPRRREDNFLGKPMHLSFWAQIEKGAPPALALFNAKKEYAAKLPHNLTRALLQAMEVKTLHQFTCLGLGW